MSSKSLEENDYSLDLEMLSISYVSSVQYPSRSGCRAESVCFRPTYLTVPNKCEGVLEANLSLTEANIHVVVLHLLYEANLIMV